MRYYDTGATLDILRKAFDGDKRARGAVDAISVPHAAAPDYSALVVVQMKAATIYDEGRVIILNMPSPNPLGFPTRTMFSCAAISPASPTTPPF